MWRWLKWGGLGLAIGSIVLAVGMMSRSSDHTLSPVASQPASQEQSRTQVDKPLIVERKGKRILWRLQAQKAEQQSKSRMHLIGPKLDLFTESDEMVPIQGKEAWFDPISRSIRFKGDVEVHYRTWVLKCQLLDYDHSTDQLHVPGAFHITGDAVEIRGKGLTAFRGTQRIVVDHGVWMKDSKPGHWGGPLS